MKLTTPAAILATLVLATTGCSGGSSGPTAAAPTPSASEQPTAATTEPAATPLEGTWTTDIERAAVRRYIREAGWGKAAEKALLDPEMAGPEDTAFRIDFVGNRFRMAQANTDEQWQSGTFTLEDGTVTLDDEAPVGVVTFRVRVDGDTVVFDRPGPTNDGFEFMPGVPDWAPAAVLWCSTTWERAG